MGIYLPAYYVGYRLEKNKYATWVFAAVSLWYLAFWDIILVKTAHISNAASAAFLIFGWIITIVCMVFIIRIFKKVLVFITKNKFSNGKVQSYLYFLILPAFFILVPNLLFGIRLLAVIVIVLILIWQFIEGVGVVISKGLLLLIIELFIVCIYFYKPLFGI